MEAATVLKSDAYAPPHGGLPAITTRVRLLNLMAVILPLLGVVAVAVLLWERGFHWVDLSLLVAMYVLTALGITVGYRSLHPRRSERQIAHQSKQMGQHNDVTSRVRVGVWATTRYRHAVSAIPQFH